jgi:hypothetical protein
MLRTKPELLVTLFFAICLLASCESAPFHPASATYTKQALRLKPSADRVAIYVIRSGGDWGRLNSVPVNIDHQEFGRLPPGSFLYAEFAPRTHVLEVPPLVRHVKRAELRVETNEPGSCYFFLAAARAGKLKQLSEEEGKQLVQEYPPSGDNSFDPGDDPLASPGPTH